MSRTYLEIQQEIQTLTQAAETIRRQEVQDVVARIKSAIAAYGLTSADLGLDRAAPVRTTGQSAAYRDAAGRTWSGRGRRPGWIHDALASGRSLEELRA